ncbi:MAG: hypothetical protein JXB07_01635 [Anaerolineae bacterium]|nr:hypothetical protein [Anaerolineae bacterium]
MIRALWNRLVPANPNAIIRGQTGLIVVTCLALAGATLLLILTWLISGDLQIETVIAGLAFCFILAVLVQMARMGRVRCSAWLLTLFLELLIGLDVLAYGLGEPGSAAFFLPILLAACGLSLWAGLGIALLSSAIVWGTAWAAYAGWYGPEFPFQLSHLTFNAPMYTVIFFIAAVLVGWWSDNLVRQVSKGSTLREN